MKAGSSIEINKPNDSDKADLGDYQRLIGKLIYLAYRTKSDIAFIVKRLSKHNTDLRKDHLQVAKRVICYLKDTIYLELVYRQKPDGSCLTISTPYSLIGYSNSNFTKDPEDRKLVMRYYFFLNRVVISWSSKKQKIILTLTTKAEYIVK